MKIPAELLLESPGQRVALCSGADEAVSVVAERLAGAASAVLL